MRKQKPEPIKVTMVGDGQELGQVVLRDTYPGQLISTNEDIFRVTNKIFYTLCEDRLVPVVLILEKLPNEELEDSMRKKVIGFHAPSV